MRVAFRLRSDRWCSTERILDCMSTPVPTRFTDDELALIDQLVAEGVGDNRSAVIRRGVLHLADSVRRARSAPPSWRRIESTRRLPMTTSSPWRAPSRSRRPSRGSAGRVVVDGDTQSEAPTGVGCVTGRGHPRLEQRRGRAGDDHRSRHPHLYSLWAPRKGSITTASPRSTILPPYRSQYSPNASGISASAADAGSATLWTRSPTADPVTARGRARHPPPPARRRHC